GAAAIANLFGAARPPQFARPRYSDEMQEAARAEAKKFNDEVNRRANEKMQRAPLRAICYKHQCKCGAEWSTFGFFAREVTVSVEGQAPLTKVVALDYNPAPEVPGIVEWQELEEQNCLKCLMGQPFDVT